MYAMTDLTMSPTQTETRNVLNNAVKANLEIRMEPARIWVVDLAVRHVLVTLARNAISIQ